MSFRTIPLVRLAFFVVLSLTDLCLTWLVLQYSDGRIVEDNPIAAKWLERFGLEGLFFFKLGGMSVVIMSVVVISSRRPRLAGWVTNLGCVVVGLVVVYSYLLARSFFEW